jgi:hypothetical protein
MPKHTFKLSSADVPTIPAGPGLQRVSTELARHGTLVSTFDNKLAPAPAAGGIGFDNRARASAP